MAWENTGDDDNDMAVMMKMAEVDGTSQNKLIPARICCADLRNTEAVIYTTCYNVKAAYMMDNLMRMGSDGHRRPVLSKTAG